METPDVRVIYLIAVLPVCCAGCSVVLNPENLEREPCENVECGPSVLFHDVDCGDCPESFEYCSPVGQCVDDCESTECGPSPNLDVDCGSCDSSAGLECLDGECVTCPDGLSGDGCLDCSGGRYDQANDLCWSDPPYASELVLGDAYDHCNDLTSGGHSNWRLPTRDEIIYTLGDCSSDVTYGLDGYCDSCSSSSNCSAMFDSDYNAYWTSTETADWDFWVADFADGEIYSQPEYWHSRVRCVREM